ncbi:hypothetical protein CC86DRAFT_423213 [Ophiobolus disseminans]|uniref:Uncharacterized protein n=1 Tax=Ophiobolus disseminans TaxID=1469910 RepID=A0A6A6ZS28_9PLEO|nr:hypothetical protein CC86DRAFT_423213 [Ophiobolus disseminans]
MARVSGGHIQISGYLKPSARAMSKPYTRHVETWSMDDLEFQYEWFEDGYSEDGTRPMEDCCFFLMAFTSAAQETGHDKKLRNHTEVKEGKGQVSRLVMVSGNDITLGHVSGLILELVDLEKATYWRTGAFRHVWNDRGTSMDNPKPEDYPEFLDFDPDNFERHVIAII